MQIGMIGAGRMGGNMVRRLLRAKHQCVVFDRVAELAQALQRDGGHPAATLGHLVEGLEPPRTVWLMLPAAAVDPTLAELVPLLEKGDAVVDGGNSHWADDLRRAKELAARGVRYVDVGVSGGVRGLERGYCLMIGGPLDAVERLEPVFKALAPGRAAAPPTPGREEVGSPAEEGWLHCGPAGAGHFVKMVHNGIEYGLMAAYAEGLNVLRHASAGIEGRSVDAETAPLREPSRYAYDLDVAAIAELWRRGSVVSSWLLDHAAAALAQDPKLDGFTGRVSDSGEGRWTVEAAIETGAPVPVLSAALFQRFASRGEDEFGRRLLSALRLAFGGHVERK
jgi:6-phosphogluconate dehydrogenase